MVYGHDYIVRLVELESAALAEGKINHQEFCHRLLAIKSLDSEWVADFAALERQLIDFSQRLAEAFVE